MKIEAEYLLKKIIAQAFAEAVFYTPIERIDKLHEEIIRNFDLTPKVNAKNKGRKKQLENK